MYSPKLPSNVNVYLLFPNCKYVSFQMAYYYVKQATSYLKYVPNRKSFDVNVKDVT